MTLMSPLPGRGLWLMLVSDVVFSLKTSGNLYFGFHRCHRPSSTQCSRVLRAYKDIHAQRDSSDGLIHGTMKNTAIRHGCCRCIGNRSINAHMPMEKAIFMLFLNLVISAGDRGVPTDTGLVIGGIF